MASRHEIISIDFRANAAKANPAMDAMREAAKGLRTEIDKTQAAIADGIKTGMPQAELEKLGTQLNKQKRELRSFENAINTLAKGVTTLSRAIDAFNSGTLQDMSAAFQKASYNAAENAKKALLPGTKDYQKNMAELDALQQKNLENLAKYKLRTEQMLQSIGKEGSKISSQDLKQEADGIQELMRLLPHMSHEWLEYNDILKQVNAAIKQQTDDEKRLTGAIVDANDARERSSQLTRKGVEEAARQRKEAEEEVKQRTENIAALKAERAEKAKQVSIDADNAIAKDKEVEKQRKVVAAIQDRIDNEKKDAERKQKNIDKLNQEATAYENNAKSFREAAETMKGEVKDIENQLEQVNEELAKMGGAAPAAPKNPVLEGIKLGADEAASATEKVSEAVKTTAEAASHEVKGLSTSIEELKQKKEELEGRRRETWFKAKEAVVEITGTRNRFGGSFDPTEEGRKAAVAKDKEAADAVVKAMEEKWVAFWTKQEEQAKLFAQKLGKELDDVDFSDFHEHILDHGKMGEYAKSWYRNFMNQESELIMTADGSIMKQRRELAKSYEDDPDAGHYRAELSLIESLHRKNSDYWKEHDRAGRIADGWTEGENAKLWEQYSQKYIHYSEVLSQKNKEKRDIDSQLVSVQKDLNEVSGKGAEVAEKSAAAKKEETKAAEENTAAKEKEVKAGETAAKAAENEKVTVESLIKRNDELKIKIAALNEERKQMLATQEKNAAAVKEEVNAYKDLSKEQAKAMLDQKQQLATFKKEDEKWQIGNREEAQRYLFDALGEINPANVGKTTMSIESSPEKISQLLGKFQERYGIDGEGEAMAAVRELMSGGGLVKSGFMNKFFMNVEENVPKVAAYSKEIKDLTAVINGEVKAVEEDTEKKRTLADVEAELKAAEKESRDISKQTIKLRNGQADAIENLTQKTDKLTEAQKDRIAAIKAETEAIRQMSQEEAKAALAEAKKVSTVGYKGGKLHMSDQEEVQQFLIGKMRTIGKVKNDNGTLSLAGGQVDALVSAFQQRYGWKDDKTNAKALLKKILQGKDGMFVGGTADLSGDIGSVTIQYAKEMYDARIERAKALVDVSNGVKKATDDVSEATRRGADAAKDATEATKDQTDAIKQQEAEVMRRKAALDKMNEEYEQANKKLKDMRQRYASLPSSGTDAALAKAQLKDEIDDYNENVVKKARADKNRLKKLWEQSAKDLTAMIGISTEETKKSTAAQNQETEAVEKGTKSRGRKKKAVEDTTQAVREEAKAEGDAAKQGEQLSEKDRKRIALEQKKQELETKRGQKIDEITKKEEAAATAEVRANNNRSEARQITKELSQAHGKNADAMGKATDEMKKLEFEQDGLNKKADEGRKALAEYDQKIDDNAEKRLEAQKKQAQAQRLTIDTMTEAIKVLEARNRAIEPESEEWVKNARLIRQYQTELDRLKQQPVLDMMTQRMGNIRNLSADALQETKKFWQGMITGAEHGSTELKEYERNLEKVAKEEEKRRQEIQAPMRKRLNNLEKLSTADLAETKRYWETVRDGVSQTSAAYKKAELAVKALTNEENRRKANVQAQYINEQMRDLNNLSTAGLTEVKRYWQAMADGARKGTDEAKDAEVALKRINEIESERRRTADKQQVRTLFGDLSKKNGEEIRAAIEAGRRLIDTYDSGGPAAKRLSQAILDAEEHLKQYGIEAERSARREAQALEEAVQRRKEQDQLMRQQLDQGTSLSESALKTQQQYWQRLIDDPKTAKESLAGYRYELERTIALQEQQASVTREERAARLNGNLRDYSTAEIREAIEAAKQLTASYKSGSTEATELTKKIVAAEEHINKYGLENERAAQKQREQIELMEEQLRRDTGLTETALKQQESYWRRLADDPKAAANEIARYFENLNKVHAIQKEQAESQTTAYGLNALDFFRGDTSNASADQIKEHAKALKAYRDSLPSKDKADVIAEIDGYLKAAGVSAKKAAEDVMDLKDALDLAEKAGDSKQPFNYSAQEIQAATKALELRREELIKQIRAERDLGNAVDAQEKELDDLTKKLRSLKFEQDNVNMSQEKMRMLIETPANAVNLDELKAAIKRADGQLRQMEQSLGQNSGEYKRFAEQVRNAKNVMKEMEGQAKASATAWEKAFSRLKTYVVMYMGFNEVWQKVSNTARDLMDLSDRMGEVRKTTGFTADEVGRLSENLKKMDVRTSLTSLMEISASAGQLGLKTLEDVQGFTEAANKLMIALPEMGREAATEMMRVAIATGEVDKIRKQLQEGTVEGSSATAVAMEKIASTIDRLRASSASTAPEITDFVKRVGAVGAQSGITIDQVAALGSTVSSLGMRVEMSATALSRMIPAIRRNAFDVAHAIGMAPEALRKMFDEAGGGMNAMLEIFQHIKDAGMDEDDIEKMLGMGDMAEIMKELNQQGARAGIVFAGLSQNVDELRAQLGTAADAYEKNIAVQQEFEKMNETTAAKWERLKNQFEEMWVGDDTQGALGTLIDMLRNLVDFISGNVSPALQAVSSVLTSLFVGFVAFRSNIGSMIVSLAGAGKAMQNWRAAVSLAIGDMGRYIALKWQLVFAHDAEAKAAIRAKLATTAATKAMLSNVVLAFVAAIGLLVWKLIEVSNAMDKVDDELARMETETEHAIHNVGNLTKSLTTSIKATDEARKKQEGLKSETEALRKEVDKLTKSSDNSTEAKDKLSQKTDELKQKEKELKAAEDESNKANSERLKLIGEINSKYSTYLGYMLSEATTAEKVASAHQLIVAALKEELRQKGINRKQEAIEQKYADKEAEYSKEGWDELEKLPRATQQRIMDAWTEVRASVTSDVEKDKNGKVTRQTYTLADIPGLKASGKTFNSEAELKAYMRKALTEIVGREVPTEMKGGRRRISLGGRNYYDFEGFINNIWGDRLTDDGFGNWAATTIAKQGELARTLHEDQITQSTDHRKTVKAAVNDINTSFGIISKTATGNQDLTAKQINTLAENVNAIVADLQKYGDDIKGVEKYVGKDKEGETNAVSLENAVSTMFADRDEKTRQRILKAARRASRTGSGGGGATSTTDTGTNIWGSNAPADSTDYSLFDVNELVARRNQMDKFKNILKPDTNIRAVLAEDKALMKALDNGLAENMEAVIGWYNTERKKIQEELKSERFSTNTGHWRDEKNGKGRKNRFRESDYALAELDRYYSRRKEKLEKAREEEGMSEELFNREAELLEQEHLERRSKLRETFTAGTSKQEREMVAQFRLWWDKLEKSGDLDEVPWATIESEWAKAIASEIGRNNLKAQQDLTQLQSITVKHLNQIAKLIDKERPYDGITANLRKNLTEMDILLADMVKDGPAADTAKLVSEQGRRLQFLLTEAEHAYALTFDDLQKKMREQGLSDWADALMIDEKKKQSLMQNLRNVYDQIQEAIKKEASIIKKQLEIQWNDMLPEQEMSMKGTFEKAISDLGLAGDQVKRANSLIGAGAASERVADKLAIQQMKVQLQMQQTYFALMQKIGDERVRQLRLSAEANDRDAKALKAKAEQLRKEGKIAEAETKEREAEIAASQALQDSFDAEHAQKSLNLAKTKEIAEEEKQRVAIQNQLEESQNRLYTSLRSWADLLTSSLQGVMEASHAGDAEYYNERAKLNLTGKGGPGAGTYIVIDDAGTSDAKAHYEYLDERQALERQHEIERENAQAEAWRKLMDDINMKMSEQITDWMNAYLQNKATEDNTAELQRLKQKLEAEQQKMDASITATDANTQAVQGLTQQLAEGITIKQDGTQPGATGGSDFAADKQAGYPSAPAEAPSNVDFASDKQAGYPGAQTDPANTAATDANTQAVQGLTQVIAQQGGFGADKAAGYPSGDMPSVDGGSFGTTDFGASKQAGYPSGGGELSPAAQQQIYEQNAVTENFISNKQKEVTTETQTGKKIASTNASTFAKMTQAVNLYGIAYQAMSNDNLSTEQKFQMIALQAAGQAAIAGLTATASASTATVAAQEGAVASRTFLELGPIAGPIALAALTAIIGGLMGMAVSKIAKGKSEIAQATGASVGAGRLATGMLTYAEGNVNELTNPASLTPGRQYNVDGADGKTYRARYMGKGAKTHITNGPEFHLVGEAGREAIIDAKTTRLLQMDDTGIWRDIQTLYNGGSISGLSTRRRRGTGVRAFADGNIGEFDEMADGGGLTVEETGDMGIEQMLTALDRNSAIQEALLERLNQPIYAQNILYGPDGLPNIINKLNKEAKRHGEKYL